MSTEFLTLLLVTFALPVLAATAAWLYGRQVGIKALMGNREGLPEPTGLAARARRAHFNLLENALPFATAVLMAKTLGVNNAWTIAGALIFLGARVAHYAVYLMGITSGIRSLAYHAGTIGILLIVVQIGLAIA